MALDPNYSAILADAAKNDRDEIERLRSALKDIIMMLDDPFGLEHVRDMRGATVIARAALKESSDG